MLRILMVTNLFYPLTGGSEHVIYELSRRLAKRGHTVHILTELTEPEWPHYECVEGIHIHRCAVQFSNPVSRFITGVLNAARLFKQLSAKYKFDLLHFHLTIPSLGVLLCKESRKAIRVASFYGPWDEEELVESQIRGPFHPGRIKASIFRYLQKKVLRHSKRIIVLSRYSQHQLLDLFQSPPASTLIPGGVDLERFRPTENRSQVKEQLQLPVNRPILLTIRRLVPRNGVGALIDAMPRILKQFPDAILIIGSKGPLRPTLEKQVEELGIQNNVLFTGLIPDEDLASYFQAADLCIMPTKALEGFGLPTIEAMACGTPVAGTAIGSTAEILGAFNQKFLIPESEAQSIAETVSACLSSDIDETLRNQCRRFVEERYDWEMLVDALEHTYGECMNGRMNEMRSIR